MMVDAPSGWGLGNSGLAYIQWYQPFNHHEVYRTLVNSHLTWLVELGWPLRFLYVLAWLSVLLILWPRKPGLLRTIPAAVWIAFAIGSTFSSVAECLWLWILPIITLIGDLWWRWRSAEWPKPRVWLFASATSLLCIIASYTLGMLSPSRGIHGSPERVIVGNGQAKVWLVTDNQVLGSNFGRTLREYKLAYAVGLVPPGKNIPDDLHGDLLIICGKASSQQLSNLKAAASHFRRLLLVNPLFYPQECSIGNLGSVTVLYGEFSHSPAIQDWRMKLPNAVQMMPEVGDFVPDWPSRLLNGLATASDYEAH
jgi:hypothetical protein